MGVGLSIFGAFYVHIFDFPFSICYDVFSVELVRSIFLRLFESFSRIVMSFVAVFSCCLVVNSMDGIVRNFLGRSFQGWECGGCSGGRRGKRFNQTLQYHNIITLIRETEGQNAELCNHGESFSFFTFEFA